MASKLKMTNSDGNIIIVEAPAGPAGTLTVGNVSNTIQTDIDSKASQADLNTANSNIATNTTNIATNTAGINSNATDIVANSSDIANLQSNQHTHANKTTIDKFGEDGSGNPTYNGSAIDTTIAQRDVYDALNSNDNTISLSAKQGKALKNLIDSLRSDVTALQTAMNTKANIGGDATHDFAGKVVTVEELIVTGDSITIN